MTTPSKTPTHQILCPECHKFQATYYTVTLDVCLDTLERDEDEQGNTWPIYETQTATGFEVICPKCGMIDGEPAML